MHAVVSRFLADESGATAIEYALIASLASIMIIAGASLLGTKLNDIFQYISGEVPLPDAD
jgi:pilus assembly protein Flp/PilA